MTSNPTDAQLIGGSRADPELFAAIFDRHVVAVHRFLDRRAGRDVADTLTGETFRIAFERRASYDTDRPAALPWLYGIAHNLLRQQRRGATRETRAVRRLHARADAPESFESLDDRLAAEARWPAVAAALAAMRPEEREVVLLVAWEELSYEEVAVALAVPVGTVRSRLHRGRRRLRERLDGNGQQEAMTERREPGGSLR